MIKEDELNYHYHWAIHWLAVVSINSKEHIEALRERLKVEAARSSDEDSVAMRCMAAALEPFLQD